MISKVSKSKPEGLNDNFALSKEEFKIEVIRDGKVEKTLENFKKRTRKIHNVCIDL